VADVANIEFLDSDLSELLATSISLPVANIEFLDSGLFELLATDIEKDRYDFLDALLFELSEAQIHTSVGNIELLGGIPESDDPVVSNISPTVASAIQPTTPITFDVTDDNNSFVELLVIASFPSLNILEVVNMDGVFSANYQALSSRTSITNGFHYSVLRAGGWPASPSFIVKSVDSDGNVNV